MKKTRVVQFSKNCGARIFVNPDNLLELSQRSDCLVDPDLREVKGLAPCFWKRQGHAAVPMDEYEMDEVRANFESLGLPYSKPDLRKLRSTFLSKNLFHRFLSREREDFQYLILRESASATKAFRDLERTLGKSSKEMETLVKDTIANFLDMYTAGFMHTVLKNQAREYNRICYKFNVIIFLFISIIMMGVIHGWYTK